MIGVEDFVEEECKSLYGYRRNSTEWILQMVLKETVLVRKRIFRNIRGAGKRRN